MADVQDTIYIAGLGKDATDDKLEAHFGAIGIIKVDKKTRSKKIWIYKDKATGVNKVYSHVLILNILCVIFGRLFPFPLPPLIAISKNREMPQ